MGTKLKSKNINPIDALTQLSNSTIVYLKNKKDSYQWSIKSPLNTSQVKILNELNIKISN